MTTEDEDLTDCPWCGHHTLGLNRTLKCFPHTPDYWSCSYCDSTYCDNNGKPVAEAADGN